MKKLLMVLCFLILHVTSKAQRYLITHYGANMDSTQLSTGAIQAAIDAAEKNGGGTIVVPKGVFLSGGLFFKPGTKLKLDEGAVLKGSDNIADYPLIPSRMEGHNLMYYAALINAYYVDSFSISGPGTINGNGLKFWKTFWAYRDSTKAIGKSATNLEIHRPRLLFIWGCNNVFIKNVKLHNSGFWTTHLYHCKNVLIEDCDIRAPFKPVPAPSSDGVDIDACKDVTVRNSYISVNDDGICIKGGKGPDAQSRYEDGATENVLVENCVFGPVQSALTMGSECIHADHITMKDCKVDMGMKQPLLRLKMRPDTYQHYEYITVENITGNCGTLLQMSPWKQFFDMKGRASKPFGTINNITLSNIHVSCDEFAVLDGNPGDKVSAIIFKDIKATADKPGFTNKYPDVHFIDVQLNGKSVTK